MEGEDLPQRQQRPGTRPVMSRNSSEIKKKQTFIDCETLKILKTYSFSGEVKTTK